MIGAELARGLQALGHRLSVVTQRSGDLPETDEYHGISVARFPFYEALETRDVARLASLRSALRKLVREFDPELVHLHTLAYPAYFCQRAIAALDVPLLVTRHEMLHAAPQPGDLASRVLGRANWVACCSRAALEEIRRFFPEMVSRSSAILNGLHLPSLPTTAVPTDPPVLLYLGRLSEPKGADLAIEAFARVRGTVPSSRLVIAGDGPAREALARQVIGLGVSDAVELTGWVAPARVPQVIAGATAVLVPTRGGEGFGLVALQAAQMGRPVIAARTGGLTEVVVDGETGVLFEPADVDGLARGILDVIQNPERTRRMGEAARTRAVDTFSADRYQDEYDGIYRRLTRSPAPRRASA